MEIFKDYVIYRNWVFKMLSKRKTQQKRDQIIYLIEMGYAGFIKSHFKIGKKIFLNQASKRP